MNVKSYAGSSDSQEIASLIAQSSSGSRDSRLTELTDYVRAAVELADAMSQAEVSQVFRINSRLDPFFLQS